MHGLIDREICVAFLIVLGHFLWQGLLIYGLAIAIVRSLTSASIRYVGLVVSLGLMAACPFVTLAFVHGPIAGMRAVPVISDASESLAVGTTIEVNQQHSATSISVAHAEVMPQPASRPLPPTIKTAATKWLSWHHHAPWMTGGYLLVVATMLVRLSIGLWGGRQLRRRSIVAHDDTIILSLYRNADLLGLQFVPIVAYCEQVTVPTLIGILKPTILLPLALTSGLTADQIESVLIHELAHLRRYDHLVNVIQRLIECGLFFHPAVWWLSNRIRIEREHCCDDLVIASGTVALDYAESLLKVAELSRARELGRTISAVSLLVTGQPSTLRHRISRFLGDTEQASVRLARPWATCGLIAAVLSTAWIIGAFEHSGVGNANRVEADEPGKANESASTATTQIADSEEDHATTAVTNNRAEPKLVAAAPQNADVIPPEKDELDELIDHAIEMTYKRSLIAGGDGLQHSPWQIMHGIKAFGLDWPLRSGKPEQQTISAAEWLAGGPKYAGEPVWQITEAGARAHPFTALYQFEGHPGQFLSWLAAADVPIDFQFKATDSTGGVKTVAVRDLVNDLKLRVNEREEMSWVLAALVHYESIDAKWEVIKGLKWWSIERLLTLELSRPIVGAPDGGCPRMFALAMALKKYRSHEAPIPTDLTARSIQQERPHVWSNVEEKLEQHMWKSKYLQNQDGSFSAAFYGGPELTNELNRRISATGVQLGWLAIFMSDDKIRADWINRAAESLARDLIEIKDKNLEMTVAPLFDSAYALKLLRERRARVVAQGKPKSQSDTFASDNEDDDYADIPNIPAVTKIRAHRRRIEIEQSLIDAWMMAPITVKPLEMVKPPPK
jgi:hypothetical protein